MDRFRAPRTKQRIGRRALLAGLGAGVGAVALARPAWARAAERYVHLVCPETAEEFAGPYWSDGTYLPEAMQRIDWVMRDFHRDAVATIDPALVDLLHELRLHAGTRAPISILSGYRTLETNDDLRHEGMPAAQHSQHLIARAADIAIDGVSVPHLHALAVHLQRGGVGGYDHYIHVDTGPVRDWAFHHPPHPAHRHRRHPA